MSEYKRCSACGIVKPLSEYGKRGDTKKGIMYACKSCHLLRHLKWSQKNRSRRNAELKKSRKENPLRFKQYEKNAKASNPLRFWAKQTIAGKKLFSRAKGLKYNLTFAWALQKAMNGKCEYTGLPLVFSNKSSPSPFSASLDRLNPADGYTIKNTFVVCHAINNLKGNYGLDKAYEVAKAYLDNNDIPY